jgi:hypothetical protein
MYAVFEKPQTPVILRSLWRRRTCFSADSGESWSLLH